MKPFEVFDPANSEKFRTLVNNDPEFKIAARTSSLSMVFQLGLEYDSKKIIAEIYHGQLVKFEPEGDLFLADPDLAFKATEDFWEKFLQAAPPANYTFLEVGRVTGHVVQEGTFRANDENMWVMDRLGALMRAFENGSELVIPEHEPVFNTGDIEPITGKYVHLEVEGIKYRVYYEEAAQGIPLVCQHTAGCDSKQFRHMMADPRLTSRFRVIAYDLPYHGKSLPPHDIKWWAEDYLLRGKFLIAFHEAFVKALNLPKGVFLGVSMGGHLALELALYSPGLYRAAIGLGSALAVPQGKLTTSSRRVSDNYCQTMMAVDLPEQNRWEVSWGYNMSAAGVCAGDAYYCMTDHDVTETVTKLDPKKTEVYILNGEYDPTTSIEVGMEIAKKNPDVNFIPMYGLGHFAVLEDYPKFAEEYLIPVLDEIEKKYFYSGGDK